MTAGVTAGAQALLAADGGGTRCRMVLLWQGQRHEVVGPGANVTTDFDGAVAVLRGCLAELAALAGVELDVLRNVPTYLGLAGVLESDTAARVAAALPLRTVRVDEDRPAALVGALAGHAGCVVSLGTGSFVGRQDARGVRFVGGHGLVLGDEASGAWLGRGMLAGALLALDGLGLDTALCAALRQRLGGVPGVIGFARGAGPAEFAALAPEVVAAANAGDPVAAAMMAEGGRYVGRALAALGRPAHEPVCLLGGLGAACLPWLPETVRAAVVPPQGSALDGALTLAARQAAEPVP